MTEVNKRNNFFTANLMFMVLGIAFILSSFVMAMADVSLKMSIVITQYVVILLPIIIVMKVKGYSIKEKFRLKRISVKTGIKAFFITLFSLPLAYTLNYLMNIILIKLDLFKIQSLDLGTGTLNFFVVFFLISITPGICEEVFFRGLMFSGYRDQMDAKKAIILTGLLFGVFHFNLQNLLLPSYLGIIFAWLVYTTDSIYPSMLGHALFNGIGVGLMYFGPSNDIQGAELEASIATLGEEGLSVLLAMGVVSLIFGAFAYLIARSLKGDFVTFKVGDSLIIEDHTLNVMDISKKHVTIFDGEEERRITLKKLKSLTYDVVLKQPVEEELVVMTEEETPLENESGNSGWNIVFVGVILVMYILFTISIYS